ncbi:juvenile hormone-binding protein-like [Achroia grisella]|uniref:juvenile hormone-binding protein-like n=1 Tax=Achroia grisella TaxID=688607 RepID=UPI0027D29CB2|nr:juvenile hormone-binding protein-like [Achroia grisella]
MTALYIFLVLMVSQCVFSETGKLHLPSEPCEVSDIDCVSKATQAFFYNTSDGIPEYDIKKLDPIVIPSLEKTIEKLNLNVHYKNVKVTGFKNQQITHFELERETKAVQFKTKVNFTAEGELTIELPKISKSFAGTITIDASAEGGAAYSYTVKTDDKGVEHYEAGPETLSCTVLGEPTIELSSDLKAALEKDADVQKLLADYTKHAPESNKVTVCNIVKTVYAVSIHNIRAAAKVLPKSAYFKNV